MHLAIEFEPSFELEFFGAVFFLYEADEEFFCDGVKEGGEVVVAEELVDVRGVIEVGDEAEGVVVFELLKNWNLVGVEGDMNVPGTNAFDGCALEGFGIGVKI